MMCCRQSCVQFLLITLGCCVVLCQVAHTELGFGFAEAPDEDKGKQNSKVRIFGAMRVFYIFQFIKKFIGFNVVRVYYQAILL